MNNGQDIEKVLRKFPIEDVWGIGRKHRRMLQAAGFTVERLPGPPGGKREILRALKPKEKQEAEI